MFHGVQTNQSASHWNIFQVRQWRVKWVNRRSFLLLVCSPMADITCYTEYFRTGDHYKDQQVSVCSSFAVDQSPLPSLAQLYQLPRYVTESVQWMHWSLTLCSVNSCFIFYLSWCIHAKPSPYCHVIRYLCWQRGIGCRYVKLFSHQQQLIHAL